MREYYGTKKIQAEPIVRDSDLAPGYLVVYEDGYRSWSPKDVFEEAYRESGRMNFGYALAALQEGRKVCRSLWIGMSDYGYLCLFPGPVLSLVQDKVETVWEAAHEDVLAEDWCIVE
jgi:Protein of unknown function (DUF2829)